MYFVHKPKNSSNWSNSNTLSKLSMIKLISMNLFLNKSLMLHTLNFHKKIMNNVFPNVLYQSWKSSMVTFPHRGIFHGSYFYTRLHGVFIMMTSCVYKQMMRSICSKAPVWSPWTNNDCTASLLSTSYIILSAIPKLRFATIDLVCSLVPQQPLLVNNCRETDPMHDSPRNSITGRVLWSNMSQFHDVYWLCSDSKSLCSQGACPLRNKTGIQPLLGSMERHLTKDAEWDWPLLCAMQQTMLYLLCKPFYVMKCRQQWPLDLCIIPT